MKFNWILSVNGCVLNILVSSFPLNRSFFQSPLHHSVLNTWQDLIITFLHNFFFVLFSCNPFFNPICLKHDSSTALQRWIVLIIIYIWRFRLFCYSFLWSVLWWFHIGGLWVTNRGCRVFLEECTGIKQIDLVDLCGVKF